LQIEHREITAIAKPLFFILIISVPLFLASPMLIFVFFIFAAACKSVNGRELFFGGLLFDIQVKDAPDFADKLVRVVLPPQARRRAYSLLV